MQNFEQTSRHGLQAASFSLSSIGSKRVVPIEIALPRADSETYSSLLESVVRSSQDAIITKNLSSIVTSWNPAATRMFGWESSEMIGHSLLRLIPPRLHFEEFEVLRRLRAGEQIDNYDTVRVTRDGREIDVSITISPLRNVHGDIIGASKIARNLTQQRASERARLHLAAIVESSDEAILSKNLDGVITSWNASAERMFGYTAEEIVGRSVLTLIPKELQFEEPRIIAKLLDGERVDHMETKRRRKNGELFDVSLTVSPIRDSTGTVIGASKILRDISQRRALEATVIEAERMASAARRANELAHEINNPLEAVTNLLYLLRLELDESSEAGKLLAMADSEVTRMANVARAILGRSARPNEPARLPAEDRA